MMEKQRFKALVHTIKNYIKKENELMVGVGVIAFVALIVFAGIMAAKSNEPQIVYKPEEACKLLSPKEAQKLFKDDVHSIDNAKPIIDKKTNTASTKCSYTSMKQIQTDAEGLIVAAVAVQSGINDKGVAINRKNFSIAMKNQKGEKIKELKQDAWFDAKRGQLNIFDKDKWIIISYGLGNHPETNKLSDALKLANLVLEKD